MILDIIVSFAVQNINSKGITVIKSKNSELELHFASFEIDSNPKTRFGAHPEEIYEKIDILEELVDRDPREAIVIAKKLRLEYPAVPAFSYLLFNAYDKCDQNEKNYSLVKEFYAQFPEYHLAKCAYALAYLREADNEGFHKVFTSLNLHELYPGRTKFHALDILAFYCVVGLYYVYEDKIEMAGLYLQLMQNIHEENDYVEELDSALFFLGMASKMEAFMQEQNACGKSFEHDCCLAIPEDEAPTKKRNIKKNQQEDMPF